MGASYNILKDADIMAVIIEFSHQRSPPTVRRMVAPADVGLK